MKKPSKEQLEQLREEAQQFVTDAEFNELMHKSVEEDRAYFEKSEIDGFMPQLKVFGLKDKKTGVRPATLATFADFDDENKQQLLFGFGTKFYEEGKHQAVAVIMTSEAWTSSARDENDKPKEVEPTLLKNFYAGYLLAMAMKMKGGKNEESKEKN